MVFKFVGFVVAALVAVGLLNFGYAWINGEADPEDAPVYINEEFRDVGVGMVPEGGGGSDWPQPYEDAPYRADPLDPRFTEGYGR